MLTSDVERYISLRQTLGFKLRNTAHNLRAYARFSTAREETRLRATSAIEWAGAASSPQARYVRLRDVVKLARFLRAEDAAHEVPVLATFRHCYVRSLPYIYSPEEIARIVTAAGRLRATYPLRPACYSTLLGLIASTGLGVSEALALRFDDLLPDGVLRIRRTKFGKARLIPLHATTREALVR